MKRCFDNDAVHIKRAAIVRLNIGGMRIDTTRDTLLKCEYFVVYLDGRMRHTEDGKGRLFIDRSGELFLHLLQFMRSSTLPDRKIIHHLKHQLIHECGFYGMLHMAHRLKGEISPADMRPADRRLKIEEGGYSYTLLDVFKADKSAKDPVELQIPLLPLFGETRHQQQSASYYEFRQRFDKIAGGLLSELVDTDGIVFAGGAVLGAFAGTPVGDIDLFLCCGQADALRTTEKVFEAVQRLQMRNNCYDLLVTRSSNAITFFRVVP